MKTFDLEKAKAGAPLCTREGFRARIVCFDADNDRKIFGLEPYYIRRSEAEELWEKKHKQ